MSPIMDSAPLAANERTPIGTPREMNDFAADYSTQAPAAPAGNVEEMEFVPARWSTSFFNLCDWKGIVLNTLCLPCASMETEALTDSWTNNGRPSSYGYWSRAAPIVALDAATCVMWGFPLPVGSAFLNMRNRRMFADQYGIQGRCSLVTDVLSTLFLPCSVTQLVNEAQAQGEAGKAPRTGVISRQLSILPPAASESME